MTTLASIDDEVPADRKRAQSKPGERRVQILHALAEMLEHPKGEKITTAALAAKLDVSEAALYRHFASKAQMFEGLIEFIETTILGLINRIASEHPLDQPNAGRAQAHAICTMLLRFAEQNRGMTRVLIGDALVGEHERLQERINQLHERIELALKQALRLVVAQGESANEFDPNARANLAFSFVVGKWHCFAKSGWKKPPSDDWDKQSPALLR
ncbi:MAG TPA: nucleoid occlusion factor SlmA [Burkholderiaceae bacterium]|nr:nucleoid occlusion factor SlmA [Burkholderiaceae bacterium]